MMEDFKASYGSKLKTYFLIFGAGFAFVFLVVSARDQLTTNNLKLSEAEDLDAEDEVDVIDSLFNDEDALVDFHGGSSYTRLTMSIPKTGTSAIEWIAQSIFSNFKTEWERQNKNKAGAPVVKNSFKYHQMDFNGKYVVFDVHGKHDTSKIEPSHSIHTHKVAVKVAHEHIPAWSDEAFFRVPHVKDYLNRSRFVPDSDKKYVVMFRDPIATVVSYMYYEYGSKLSKENLSQRIQLGNSCAKTAANMALLYRVVTEVLPPVGYQIYPMFFDEMRTKPARFVSELAQLLGLTVNSKVIEAVVQETSPEHMKSVQQNHDGIGQYSGLSRAGKNSRKVRNAALKGYMDELEPEVLRKCLDDAAFHLPPVLRERWGFEA
mmetsp:Transcript_10072/g.12097  ORF Transcript_10072/g.12097 Transcript_10072/m.12097 type:complete len:375 (+) Transcript_10072:317-1441(+)|eukprot:CAMPEP_0184034894 /NCGR_PEP_ID=MMETSP0955-20130417/21168_1 /TAXON_ID=627963 /ORGANISM="Aplanochytrium sp, Strain PBS07" /LENGTH=374 /DNA_ID=CAMNT_0026321825 /DNA_START=184 /DNA_END=1308 /DNA_ORIENTATION=+